MNTPTSPKREECTLSRAAFGQFLLGFLLPFVSLSFRKPDGLIFAACAASILAVIFGALSWRCRLGKIAATGAGLVCVLGLVNLIRFFST
jgi:hypothetical protein